MRTPRSSLLVLATLPLFSGGCRALLNFYTDQYSDTSGPGGGGGAGLCAPGAIVACYDGPTGTEGVGLCKPGAKTCAADGASFGACEGVILPVAENCATPVDEDCDGLAPPCKGAPLWSERAGDATDQFALGVAVDSAGDVLVVGYFSGTMNLGGCPHPLSSAGSTDLFVAKLDPSGACLWSKGAGDAKGQYGYGIAVDDAGNVLVTGSFSGTMDLGGCPLLAEKGNDQFVAKLDPSGACLWSKDLGPVYAGGVAVDSAGNVLVTGSFSGTMDLDECPLSSAGGSDLFVAKLDPTGSCLWSKGAGDTDNQHAGSVAVDSAGNVLVTGRFSGTLDLGGCPPLTEKGSGLYIAKLDPSGACLWSKDSGDAYGGGVAVDGAGNVLVTGSFPGTMDLGGCPLSSTGDADLFIVKLDPSGMCLWSKSAGATIANAPDIAADSAGNVLVTGSFHGSLNFGLGSIASIGLTDFFLVKLDVAGESLWIQRAGGPSDDQAIGVAVDNVGNALVTGYFSEMADFAPAPLVSAGGADIFVAKFGP